MDERWHDDWISRRLSNCTYRDPGAYFVTVCTHNRACLLGDIVDGVMTLSEAGEIADAAWRSLPIHFPQIELDTFVVMPNHIHGILVYSCEGPALGTVVGGFKGEVSRRLGRRIWQRATITTLSSEAERRSITFGDTSIGTLRAGGM